jgi:hypothetical protein
LKLVRQDLVSNPVDRKHCFITWEIGYACYLSAKQSTSFHTISRELHGDYYSVTRGIWIDLSENVAGGHDKRPIHANRKQTIIWSFLIQCLRESESENYVACAIYSN